MKSSAKTATPRGLVETAPPLRVICQAEYDAFRDARFKPRRDVALIGEAERAELVQRSGGDA
jgi:hypothetical protein